MYATVETIPMRTCTLSMVWCDGGGGDGSSSYNSSSSGSDGSGSSNVVGGRTVSANG